MKLSSFNSGFPKYDKQSPTTTNDPKESIQLEKEEMKDVVSKESTTKELIQQDNKYIKHFEVLKATRSISDVCKTNNDINHKQRDIGKQIELFKTNSDNPKVVQRNKTNSNQNNDKKLSIEAKSVPPNQKLKVTFNYIGCSRNDFDLLEKVILLLIQRFGTYLKVIIA